MRVDHKVWFSAERTFIQWIHLATTLGLTSLGLLALADNSSAFLMTGTMLALPAAFFVGWAAVQFHRRVNALKMRHAPDLEDKLGPLLAVCVMTSAVTLHTVLAWRQALAAGTVPSEWNATLPHRLSS
jgi:uncharacterized membrane protein YidH (DUF202 family)